jgi:predicted metal-binding membrane protein
MRYSETGTAWRVNRDSAIILLGLLGIVLLAWAYLIHMGRMMAESVSMAQMGMMAMTHDWDHADLLMTFLMWAVMMVAMMVPSATPMILTFATVNRNRAKKGGPFVPTSIFLAGYLTVWTAFSLAAALVQNALHSAALLEAQKLTVVPSVGGGLLVAAGLFQISPWKSSCLTHCRSPLDFLTTEWREGKAGALWMGIRHGAYCAGCCWLLMLLLFVAGVMNLLWVAAISIFVLGEKLFPYGRFFSYLGASACVLAGVALFLGKIHLS